MKIFFLLTLITNAWATDIALINLKGSINPGSAAFIKDALSSAQSQNLQALILKLDTPGGLLSSTRDIVQAISLSKIPVITFVAPGGASATSAGAIIGISSHVLAMAPGTNIGAAHPVEGSGQDVKGNMGEKIVNDTSALVRSQAALRDRNVVLAQEIVQKSTSLTPEEAQKQTLIDIIAKDNDDLMKQLDGREIKVDEQGKTVLLETTGASLKVFEMTLSQKILHLLADPNISTMLMALGGIAIYAEVSSGFTVIAPGVFGVISLVLAFISLQLLPIHVGGLILLFSGAVMLIAEAFLVSYGLLGFFGLASIVLGAMFMIDPASGADLKVSWAVLGPTLSGIAVVFAFIAWQLRLSRENTKVFDPLVGVIGKLDTLNPDKKSGKILVQGVLWDFTSDNLIEKNIVNLKVLGKTGLTLKVKPD